MKSKFVQVLNQNYKKKLDQTYHHLPNFFFFLKKKKKNIGTFLNNFNAIMNVHIFLYQKTF